MWEMWLNTCNTSRQASASNSTCFLTSWSVKQSIALVCVCVCVSYMGVCVYGVCVHMLVGVLICKHFHSPGVRVCVMYGCVHAPTTKHKHITRNIQFVASSHRSCVIHLFYFLISFIFNTRNRKLACPRSCVTRSCVIQARYYTV